MIICSQCQKGTMVFDNEKKLVWCIFCGYNEEMPTDNIDTLFPKMMCGHRANDHDQNGEPVCIKNECFGKKESGYDVPFKKEGVFNNVWVFDYTNGEVIYMKVSKNVEDLEEYISERLEIGVEDFYWISTPEGRIRIIPREDDP